MDLKPPRVNRMFTSKFDIGVFAYLVFLFDVGVFAYLDVGRSMFDVHLLIAPEPSQGTPMKTILTLIAVAIFLIYPSICFSSYIIHLKDGREFVTDRYWEEGDQIKFKRYGGVIGIQGIKDLPDEQDAMARQTASLTA